MSNNFYIAILYLKVNSFILSNNFNNNKLFSLLKTFSVVELTRLKKFLQSPYHNRRNDVILLLDSIVPHLLDEKKLTKKHLHEKIFPNTPFVDADIRHLMSYLKKLVELFLIQEEMADDSSYQNIQLLKAYRKRKLNKHYHSQELKTQTRLRNSSFKGYDFYNNSYQFSLEQYTSSVLKTKNIQEELQQLSNRTDEFYIINKLKQACNAFGHKIVLKVDYQLHFIEPIVAYIEQLDDIPPAINIYYNTYQMITSGDATYFEQLKQLIVNHATLFPPEEMRDIYLLAINFCIKQLNTGNIAYVREVFDLYQSGLQSEVLLEHGILTPWTYKNIAAAGMKLEEYEWVAQFLEHYKSAVTAEYREPFYRYNLAKLNFAQGQFKVANRLLYETEIKDLFTHLDAKVIVIKSNYELGKEEFLDHLLENFKQFLRRKEVLTYHKKNYSNFIKLMRKLIYLKAFEDKAKLVEEINAAEILTEREWLLAQVKKL